MASLFENKDRKVIPNFRPLQRTINLGELSISQNELVGFEKGDIGEYVISFKEHPTSVFAGELVSAAIVNNDLTEKSVKDAATTLINDKTATTAQKALSKKILGIEVPIKLSNINSIDDFLETNSPRIIHERLRDLKSKIAVFDRNPFLYCELARMYSIIGQKESAIKNILIAKQLAPSNRYILRSFSRLMAHYNDLDQAHDALRKNSLTKRDPWLLASEISIAALKNKNSNLIKVGKSVIESKQFSSFSISELASSLATVELMDGSRKKSKEFFLTALIDPNDNSLAQVQWANNRDDLFDMDVKMFKVENNSEAITLDCFNSEDWVSTLKYAEQWFMDMPFAKRPVMFGHNAASFYLEDHELAIKFCKAGLIANPTDPLILNNIAYSYCMLGNFKEAFSYLLRAKHSEASDTAKICLLATTGLAYYKMTNITLGRQFYLEAMNLAKQLKNIHYFNMAFMNFAREEIQCNPSNATEIYNQAMDIKSDKESKDVEIMKTRIKKAFEKSTL